MKRHKTLQGLTKIIQRHCETISGECDNEPLNKFYKKQEQIVLERSARLNLDPVPRTPLPIRFWDDRTEGEGGERGEGGGGGGGEEILVHKTERTDQLKGVQEVLVDLKT